MGRFFNQKATDRSIGSLVHKPPSGFLRQATLGGFFIPQVNHCSITGGGEIHMERFLNWIKYHESTKITLFRQFFSECKHHCSQPRAAPNVPQPQSTWVSLSLSQQFPLSPKFLVVPLVPRKSSLGGFISPWQATALYPQLASPHGFLQLEYY